MLNIPKENILLPKNRTKHICPACKHYFFVLASFFECPNCKRKTFAPALGGYSTREALKIAFNNCLRYSTDKKEIYERMRLYLPTFTADQIKALYEEIV